jgi:MarR family transcriptional regulator for hemolysin
MLEYDFENSPGFWICQASHAFQRAFNEELAPQGITFRQCQVLGFLALENELSQNDLAERMGLEPPTLVGILDRMERDGWISRNADKTDRRRKLIRPMPAAMPVWKKIVATANFVRERAAGSLTKAELAQLKRLLAIVQANLQVPATSKEAG